MRSTSGMTLLECCITIAIIAFVSFLGACFIGVQSQSLLRFEVEKLYNAVMYVQRKAIATGITQSMLIDVQNKLYVVDGGLQKLAPSTAFGYPADAWGPPSHPVYQIDKYVTFNSNTIICYPDGTISSGTIYLKDTRSRYFVALTSGISPTVYLRMYRYETGKKRWYLIKNQA